MSVNNNNLMLYFAMIIATIIVVLFSVAFVADIRNPTYDIPAGIYPMMTVIVGTIIGFVFKRSTNGTS